MGGWVGLGKDILRTTGDVGIQEEAGFHLLLQQTRLTEHFSVFRKFCDNVEHILCLHNLKQQQKGKS